MNENDDYTYVQRRLCAVMAKSEWTSSRMRMQKSGEELRERRAKSHQTANKFLQELLEKRTDSDLIDDNGAVDRYHKFVKYKSALNDDTNSTLDEFDRRLRALNNNRRNQTKKLNNQNLNTIQEKNHQLLINDLQSTIEVHNDKDINVQEIYYQERPKPSRILPIITTIPVTSTPNDTPHESTTPVFHDDEIQELSNVQSTHISFIDSQENHIDSSIHEDNSSLLGKADTINSSTSSLGDSLTQTLFAPKALRPDGTEMILSSTSKSPLSRTSSNILLLNNVYFPRSLTSRGKININSTSKRQLPSIPYLQSNENKEIEHEQFDTKQLYDLLDHLDNNTKQYSNKDFTNMLDQLTLSTVIHNNQDHINMNFSIENLSLINNNDNNYEEIIFPNIFDQSLPATQEKLFYTTLTINMDDVKNILLYTMTISTVQISASILVPYSILNGRRPFLKCSKQTHFKQIHSKQQQYTCQVTAIESSLNIKQLQQNDIILKINDQSVWGLTTDEIMDILKQYGKQSNNFSLTMARLCQPFL
ncbi:unnamed protein product [Rotaria sp. Silwood1]|nr:unnamed protein product [Rotaria sp. Silwood1]CAF0838834.1 unnamed protein product [Rotaria sp. Silwood1]CAF3340691.1 unnamed protein product [Rotaria sp. Silwood1]CAF3363679.1 unnamed protein product [Rotaria sp. Silwood1]